MHAWEQIQITIEYIEQHLDEEINMNQLAKIAALSPFYYQRLFSRLVKKPVAEYIKLRRMARATDALLQRDKRILDIALELGFSSHEHFTRTFKDTFGMTPDEYRRQPQPLNRMTKPELVLHYILIDEGVPLIADGIVLEINRKTLAEPIRFTGLKKEMPVSFPAGLGTESGIDPLYPLWETIHERKHEILAGAQTQGDIGVSYPSQKKGYFNYFAGIETASETLMDDFIRWELPAGEYIVCNFEAEDFNTLVMDTLYKAQQYLFGVWLPNHKLTTEPFCAERYPSHSLDITAMELWLKIK